MRKSLLPIFLRPRAIWRFLRDKSAPIAPKIVFLISIAYAVMPLDFVPDAVPILGWLDDLGLLGAAFTWLATQVNKHERTYEEREVIPEGNTRDEIA